jgi:hypothetical protein
MVEDNGFVSCFVVVHIAPGRLVGNTYCARCGSSNPDAGQWSVNNGLHWSGSRDVPRASDSLPVSVALILPDFGKGEVMAYWCTLWVLQWWGFWRLPVTEASARVATAEHSRKVIRVKWLWSVGLLVVLVVPVPAFAAMWVLILTFVSFVLLDETA